MEIRGQEDIPNSAAELYTNNDTFREYVNHLDFIVDRYNKVRKTVLEVEYPLIEGQLEEIDIQLEKAEESLNWQNESE